MARPKNQVQSVKVSFMPTATVAKYLDDLVALGLHGKARPDVVNGMVIREIERLIRDGFLKIHKD